VPELVEQTLRGAERAAERRDVLTQQEDALVIADGVREGSSNGFEVGDLGDRRSLRRPDPLWPGTVPIGRFGCRQRSSTLRA
jgi:hypothetical protein